MISSQNKNNLSEYENEVLDTYISDTDRMIEKIKDSEQYKNLSKKEKKGLDKLLNEFDEVKKIKNTPKLDKKQKETLDSLLEQAKKGHILVPSRKKEMEEALEEADKIVSKRYIYPNIPSPILAPSEQQTAHFSFEDNQIVVDPVFVEKLKESKLDDLTAMVGTLMHEVGHYMTHPIELYHLMIMGEAVDSFFKNEPKDIKDAIANFYSDVVVNLSRMNHEKSGKELREVYSALTGQSGIYDFVALFYEDRLPALFDSKITMEKLKEKFPNVNLEEKLEELRTIDYENRNRDNLNVFMFGSAILPLLKEQRKQQGLPQQGQPQSGQGQPQQGQGQPQQGQGQPQQGQGQPQSGQGSGGDEEENAEDREIGPGHYNPMFDQSNDAIKKASEEAINDALNKIAKRKKMREYNRIRDYVDALRGKESSQQKSKTSSHIPGLESSKITWHDDLIDYYRKKAGGKIFIHKKPVKVESTSLYPDTNSEYQIGDPFNQLDRFSSPMILPGITQKKNLKAGTETDFKHHYPDLWISLDTSGSMRHPKSDSTAVYAAFALALNYHKNGSKIGVMNFSCDSTILLPTREINDVYKMLCAYWGGGTVFDVEKMKHAIEKQDYFKRIGVKGYDSNNKDYDDLIKRLTPEQKKEFEKKELNVRMKKDIKEKYNQIDHVMITDGDIFNIDHIVNYFNEVSGQTRNTLIVVENRACASQWDAMNMHNTQVIAVDDRKDLYNVAIGKVKKLKKR